MRTIQFQNGEYYHIYNRGVDKRNIFIDNKDYLRFLRSIKEFNVFKPIGSLYELNYRRQLTGKEAKLPIGSLASLIEIICYCLIPNHFHFLIKQISNYGIERFMHKLSTGYTNYFNSRHNRSGSLFQGTYKAIHIKTNDHLLQLSCYVHGNPEIHGISQVEKWLWSSYKYYLNLTKDDLVNKSIILKQFKKVQEYKNLVKIIIKDSAQAKNELKQFEYE